MLTSVLSGIKHCCSCRFRFPYESLMRFWSVNSNSQRIVLFFTLYKGVSALQWELTNLNKSKNSCGVSFTLKSNIKALQSIRVYYRY